MNADLAVTWAVPTYNRGATLRPLLETIRDQARPEDELLVSDDGSTDDTAEVVRSVPPFVLLRQPVNLGMVGNWNACLHAAQRPWIGLIHDDDRLAPGGLDTLRRACALAGRPAVIAHSEQGTDIDQNFRYRFCEPGAWSVLHAPGVPSGVVAHHDTVAAAGGFDPSFAYSADLEYYARLAARFPLLVIESPAVVKSHYHEGNYQFKTWRKPDFWPQFERLQRTVIAHAGLSPDDPAGRALLDARLTGNLGYMFHQARRWGDAALVRQVGGLLLRHGRNLGRRTRAAATVSALTGWRGRVRR